MIKNIIFDVYYQLDPNTGLRTEKKIEIVAEVYECEGGEA